MSFSEIFQTFIRAEETCIDRTFCKMTQEIAKSCGIKERHKGAGMKENLEFNAYFLALFKLNKKHPYFLFKNKTTMKKKESLPGWTGGFVELTRPAFLFTDFF